jgi:hypothetical protein
VTGGNDGNMTARVNLSVEKTNSHEKLEEFMSGEPQVLLGQHGLQCSDLECGQRTKVPDATFVGQVNKLPEYDAGARKTRPACRIISPVPGAAFDPSSPIVKKGYVQVEGHMYDFSTGQTFDVNFVSFPAQLGDDGLNHHVFQKVHTITDGNDLRFEVSVRYPAPGRYTFVFRWTQRENDGSNHSVGICKADFELLAADVPIDAESLFMPLRSLPVSSGGGNPCVDEFHCSDEYRELRDPSEGTMERLHQISAEQVLAETRMIRISIDAPLAGQTLVSGGETEVKISINVENGSSGPCEDLELRVMAHSDISHLQLYRAPVNVDLRKHTYINLISDVKITLGPGIWTLTAKAFPRSVVDTSTVVARNLRINIQEFILEQIDSESVRLYGALRGFLDLKVSLAKRLLEMGHLEESLSQLGDSLRTFVDGVVHVAQIERLQELRRTINNELAQISASTLASHSIFCLTVSQESNNVRLTMEQGCPGLHELHQDTRGGFAEFTWMRTLECLFAFVNRFPDNYEAKVWLSKVLSVVGVDAREKREENADGRSGMGGKSGIIDSMSMIVTSYFTKTFQHKSYVFGFF